MKIYIYHDSDHGDIEIFRTLDEAQAYGEGEWETADDDDEDVWEKFGKRSWGRGEYQHIYMRELK